MDSLKCENQVHEFTEHDSHVPPESRRSIIRSSLKSQFQLFLRYTAIALLLFAGVLVTGCTSADLGEVTNAKFSKDGKYLAVVHRLGSSLVLSVSTIETEELYQRNVAGSSLAWSDKDELACEVMNSGMRSVSVFSCADFSKPVFSSRYFSMQPVFEGASLFYLAMDKGKKRIFSADTETWNSETEFLSAPSSIEQFSFISPNKLIILQKINGSEKSSEATAERISKIEIGTTYTEIARRDLDTSEDFAQNNFDVTVDYCDMAAKAPFIPLVERTTFSPKFTLSYNSAEQTLIYGNPDKLNCIKLKVKGSEEKPRISTKVIDIPLANVLSSFVLDKGVALCTRSGIFAWEFDKRTSRLLSGYPLEIAQVYQKTKWGWLVSVNLEGLPSRYVALLSENSGYRFFPLTSFYASELRSYLVSKRSFLHSSTISTTSLADSTELFLRSEPHDFNVNRETIPVAEVSLTLGEVDKAIKIYEESEKKYSLRLAEIYLFHKYDLENTKKWLSKISDIKQRKWVDLYIEIISTETGKLKESYLKSRRMLDVSDMKSFVESSEYYFKKSKSSQFDPGIYLGAIDYFQYQGDEERVTELLAKLESISKEHSFYQEVGEWLIHFYIRTGQIDKCIRLSFTMAETFANSREQNLQRIIDYAFDSVKETETVHKAIDARMKYRLSFEDSMLLRLKKMALYSLHEKDYNSALEQANYLAWGAFETTDSALEAGFWSIVLNDLHSHDDVNLVIQRFCKNPRFAVRGAVSQLVLVSLQSGIAHLTQDDITKGAESLPQWFIDRCMALKVVPDIQSTTPAKLFEILLASDYELKDLELLSIAAETDALARTILTLKLAMDSVSKNIAREKARQFDVHLNMAFLPPLEKQQLLFDLQSLKDIGGMDPSFWIFIAKNGSDFRLNENMRMFTYLSGKSFTKALVESVRVSPYSGSRQEATQLCELLRVADWSSLTEFLSERRDSSTIPFWRIMTKAAIFRGDPDALIACAKRGIESESADVVSAALDAMCFVYLHTENEPELEKCILKLFECKGKRFSFFYHPKFAYLMAMNSRKNGKEADTRKWLVEYMIRGGVVNVGFEKVMEFLEQHTGILEDWADKDVDSLVYFIYMHNADQRVKLLEQCGEKRATIEEQLKVLDGDE